MTGDPWSFINFAQFLPFSRLRMKISNSNRNTSKLLDPRCWEEPLHCGRFQRGKKCNCSATLGMMQLEALSRKWENRRNSSYNIHVSHWYTSGHHIVGNHPATLGHCNRPVRLSHTIAGRLSLTFLLLWHTRWSFYKTQFFCLATK